MKHTEIADAIAFKVKSIIDLIESIQDEGIIFNEGIDGFLQSVKKSYNDITKINLDELKNEFWLLANDLNNVPMLKAIYEVKFERLLQWKRDFKIGSVYLIQIGDQELAPFIQRHTKQKVAIPRASYEDLVITYYHILIILNFIRLEVDSLLKQCEAMIRVENQQKQQFSVDNKSQKSKFCLASKKKTDFIKIVSAMYDARLFETLEGFLASSKQALFDELGQVFGEDFSKYSTFLSQAKVADLDTFLKPFHTLLAKAEHYYDTKLEK